MANNEAIAKIKSFKIEEDGKHKQTYSVRPLINPALILKRYSELIDRAQLQQQDRVNEFKEIQVSLETIKSKADKRTVGLATKLSECVKLTSSGISLLDNEVKLLKERLPAAIGSLPAELVEEANQQKEEAAAETE